MSAAAGVLDPAALVLAAVLVAVWWRQASVRRRCLRRLAAAPGRHDDAVDHPDADPDGRGASSGEPVAGAGATGARRRVGRAARSWRHLETGVGGAVRRAAGRTTDQALDARLGRALLVAAVAVVGGAGPAVAAAGAVATWVLPVAAAARRRARRRRAIGDETPEVVELVRLAVGAGLNVRLALDAVGRHHQGLIASEVRRVLGRVERGERLADALDAMALDDDSVRPLVDALVATERGGAPLVESLDRVAADARTAARRRAEEAARRVPVKLLFPLVFCTLPAFVLLTVVPVLLRSLPSFAP